MSATTLGAFVAISAGNVGGIMAVVWYFGHRIERLEDRMERLEDRQVMFERVVSERFTGIEVTLARIEQRLVDHITDHPGPTERLVR